MMPILRRFDRNILIILAISLFAWAPLLTPAYFFQAHDAQHSIFYLVEFDQTLRDGYLWPRWSPDFAFGYGYPLFNIYSPLAIYAAEILHLLGLSLEGDFAKARDQLRAVMLDQGLSGVDLVSQMHREALHMEIEREKLADLLKLLAEYEFRLVEGSNDLLQCESLIAQICSLG
jgi:hypothetical protein